MKKLALFIAQPYVSVQSNNGIIESLQSSYTFKLFTKQQVEDTFFDDVDGIVIGGGFGDVDSYDHLLRTNQNAIKKFISNGGKYIGICMGGYWASSDYFDLLQGCQTVQYIRRPNTDTHRPHAKNLDVVWNGCKEKMFFYDGFAVTPGNYQIYASYMNKDPMAIIQNNIGIIGCHPEATPHYYNSYSWMQGKFESKQHLLKEFVDQVFAGVSK